MRKPFRDHNTSTVVDDHGRKKYCSVMRDIMGSVKSTGCKKDSISRPSIYGVRLGEFSRGHRLTTEDFEMLVVVEK